MTESELTVASRALEQALNHAILYYQNHSLAEDWQKASTISAAVAAIIALITAVIMAWTTAKTLRQMRQQVATAENQTRESNESFLSERWDQIYAECVQYPDLLDATVIELITGRSEDLGGHKISPSSDMHMRYSAFCYRLWNLVSEVVKRGFKDEPRFRALINWAKELHGEWLIRNPDFFTDSKFWDALNEAQKNPHMIMRYKALPHKGMAAHTTEHDNSVRSHAAETLPSSATPPHDLSDDIDWGYIASRYFYYILSPLHPDLFKTSSEKKSPRNPIGLAIANKSKELRKENKRIRIVEFGCGPGTLINVLSLYGIDEVDQVVFVDSNEIMLSHAKARYEAANIRHNKPPEFHVANMRNYRVPAAESEQENAQFDVVVCVNSVLTVNRKEVVETFRNLRRHKNGEGDIFLILPSYDTTEYLENLWYAKARSEVEDPRHADRVRTAFQKNKHKPSFDNDARDFSDQVFADDGNVLQGYHSPQSIKKEMEEAGLKSDIQPIFYPWEICRRFDYGYFPNAKEHLLSFRNDLRAKYWNIEEHMFDEIWDWFVQAR